MVFVRCTDDELKDRRRRWNAKYGPDGDLLFPWNDLECWRWATEDEARDGHRMVVDTFRVLVDSVADETVDDGGACLQDD